MDSRVPSDSVMVNAKISAWKSLRFVILLELKKGEIFMNASKSLRKIQTGPTRHRLSTEFIEKNGTLCASRRTKAEFYVITDTINRLIDGKFGLKDFHVIDYAVY